MSDERLELEQIPSSEGQLVRAGYPRPGYGDNSAYGYSYGYREDNERDYLRRMWQAIRKRKLVVLVIAVLVTSVVTVEIFRSKSIYQAATTIEIGKENRMLVRSGDVVIQTDEPDDTYLVALGMKTKMRLLQSRPLLEDVVVNLKLDHNPKFMDVTAKKSFWEAMQSILSKFRPPDSNAGALPAVQTSIALPSEAQRSREESARLSPYVDVLAANLSTEPLADTRMLVISFTHTDPEIAADVVDNVAQVFIQRNFENKTESYTNTSNWLERSTRELKAKVEQAEIALADYSRANNIYSTEGKENLAIDKLSRLHDQATRAETDRILKQSLYEEVLAGRADKLPEAFVEARTAELQKKLGDLTVQAAQMDATYGPKNPRVIELRQQITAIQQQVDESRYRLGDKLKADYERAVRDEASLKAALERAKAEAAQQNQAAIQYSLLKQDVETAKQLYTDFLQKTNQAKIQEHEQHNNLKMIDPPQVPRAPLGPNRARVILIGFFLSLCAGLGLALLLEYLDNTVKTVEDIARYAQLPALSVIPSLSSRRSRRQLSNGETKFAALALGEAARMNTDAIVALDTRSSSAEAYRALRTAVLLSSVDRPPKLLLVTSGKPGEGKTTTAINTAISLSQLGNSVLILDCDLRKPSVHKVLGIEQTCGLSTYLSRDAKLIDVMQKVPIPNLWVMPCGPIPPNPAEMISSFKMKKLLRTLSENFDYIIIDSPPLLKVTDPVILSTMVDGVILVVQSGKSTRDVLRRARQELSLAGAKIFGVVLNNVDTPQGEYYEYYGDYSDYEHEASAHGD
ncbi:MAG: polysaccharide biosynthesis transport protein [Blastocatellia bacterium]